MENKYNITDYWDIRFNNFKVNDFRGVGNFSLSSEENKKEYEHAKEVFLNYINQIEDLDFSELKVLDIGCGNGFYTNILKEHGVTNYTGIDITDAYFLEFKKQFPDYRFKKQDVRLEKIDEKYNCILILDVLQHIVEEDDFDSVLRNTKDALTDGGFIVLTHDSINNFNSYHVRNRTKDYFYKIFKDYIFLESVIYRDKCLTMCFKI